MQNNVNVETLNKRLVEECNKKINTAIKAVCNTRTEYSGKVLAIEASVKFPEVPVVINNSTGIVISNPVIYITIRPDYHSISDNDANEFTRIPYMLTVILDSNSDKYSIKFKDFQMMSDDDRIKFIADAIAVEFISQREKVVELIGLNLPSPDGIPSILGVKNEKLYSKFLSANV